MGKSKKFLKDPYAWECVKVVLSIMDPRPTQLEKIVAKLQDMPPDYKFFDNFIMDHIGPANIKRRRAIRLTEFSLALIREWRAKDYILPITDQLATVLSFLPTNVHLKTLLAKDALMKEGLIKKEYRQPRGHLRQRMKAHGQKKLRGIEVTHAIIDEHLPEGV